MRTPCVAALSTQSFLLRTHLTNKIHIIQPASYFFIYRCQFMYGELTDKETIARLDYTLENQLQDQFEVLLYKNDSKSSCFISFKYLDCNLLLQYRGDIISLNFCGRVWLHRCEISIYFLFKRLPGEGGGCFPAFWLVLRLLCLFRLSPFVRFVIVLLWLAFDSYRWPKKNWLGGKRQKVISDIECMKDTLMW